MRFCGGVQFDGQHTTDPDTRVPVCQEIQYPNTENYIYIKITKMFLCMKIWLDIVEW